MTTFRTNPVPLSTLLANVDSGKIQLPDFQRGWVWDDYRIRALLASISRGFPIGAVMTLDAGGDVNFATRLVEGVNGQANGVLDQFLLDGQQRLTSLYQALISPATVTTRDSRGARIKRWYYVDMLKAMDATSDREDAIVSVPEDKRVTEDFGRRVTLDLSTPEQEYANHMMPTERLLDAMDWLFAYNDYWQGTDRQHPRGDVKTFRNSFNEDVVKSFSGYALPVIALGSETPKEAVCTVFEKVNTGGVTLTVFELVTASFAASNFSLRDDWDERRGRMRRESVLHGVGGEQFLQAVALLATQRKRRERERAQPDTPPNQLPRIGCQKRDVLNLTLDEYQVWAAEVEGGFFQAAKFLHSQYVFNAWDVPYATQLVPLAALFVELGSDLEDANARERLEHWYWSGIFGEAYGSAIETQYARDLEQVAEYVRTGAEPLLVEEANFVPQRLLSLRTRNSAAYKGLYALQMKNGAADWRTGEKLTLATYHDEAIDIHHIFPVAWCQADPPIPADLYNSIINKTPIDAGTNRRIGGRAPSEYLPRLRSSYSNLDEALQAHWVNPDHLEEDDFYTSFVERGEQMLSLIGKAMRKDIPGGREVFRNALLRGMPADLIPEGEAEDADDDAELQEFDDGENEYDDLGSAAYDDDEEAA